MGSGATSSLMKIGIWRIWSFKYVCWWGFFYFFISLYICCGIWNYFLGELYRNSVYWMGFSTNSWGLLAFVRFGDARL